MRSPKLLPAALLAACALGAAAAPATAEIVTYVDGRNVWAENVDGSFRRQITTDGDEQRPYAFPSANDAGDVAALQLDLQTGNPAIVFVAAAGGARTVNMMPAWGLGVTVPFAARIQPEGRLLAYTFARMSGSGGSRSGNVVPADAPGSPTGPGPGFPGMLDATWHAGRLVWSNGNGIAYGDGAEANSWINGPFFFGEVSRDATRLLAAFDDGGRRAIYQTLTGPMPSATDGPGCYVPTSGELGDVALSPSGATIAFTDAAGLHVARPAIGADNTPCALQDRIVSPTASDPSFSNAAYTVPAPPPQPGPPAPPAPTPTPPVETGRGGGRGGGAKAAVATRSLRQLRAKGLTVRLSGLPRGTVNVTAKLGRTALGSARVRVGASGRATVTVRLTKAGRRALRGKRSATVTIVAGAARTQVRLR
jgi:hypothetical protein